MKPQISDSTSYPRHFADASGSLPPCTGVRAEGHHVPPHGGKPEGIPDGVFGRAPVPQARLQSGEDLPTGGFGDGDGGDVGGVPVQAAVCP
jgi:hypothetical protein